jgi:uncharacterized RDD family membrane protein YckC
MGLRFPPSGFTDRTAARAGVRYASWLRRFAGALIDGLLISMINYLIGGIFSFAPSPFTSAVFTLFEILSLLSLISILYATLCLDKLHGQTPGMRVMQIRCVPAAGHGRISTTQAVVRSVAAAAVTSVPWFFANWIPLLWLVPIAAYLWPLVDSRHQTWWDHAANTVVLSDVGY